MPATLTDAAADRMVEIRVRCAKRTPPVRYNELAAEAGLAYSTTRNVMSGNVDWDPTSALDKLEAAMDRIEAGEVEA